jgi:hypothetical protein
MLRPHCFQKNIIAFVTLALVILYITEPTLAQRTNRKNSESSGSGQARQQQAERERRQRAERERQQQAERERQKQAERERQKQAERERQQRAERERQQQAEREKQKQAEREKQKQAERERQKQAERERQKQAERERQKQAERERQKQAEWERQKQAERERQQQAERERRQRAERERQQQAERERQKQAEQERQRQAEQAKQQQAERERRRQAEQAREKQAERARQQQAERERQQQAERERQKQAERERQQQAERERQRQAEQAREQARQQQAEQARQQKWSERINRKQLIRSPNDGELELRTHDEMAGRVNRKHPLPNNTKTVVVGNSAPTASPGYRYGLSRRSHLVYRDRPYATDTYRREHTYMDYSGRIRTRTITPSYRFILCYNRGPRHTFRYFYSYYHRKYVFVSLGGYWPFNCRFIRYYWYGYHPYYWCGYFPIAREVVDSSYTYYTYNYYYEDYPVSYPPNSTLESQYYDNMDLQLAEEPAGVTLADIYFEEAVRAFEEGNYGLAIEKFAKAMELAPDDMILPFAYSQALFAAQRYTEAAEILRSALAKISPDKEGVFYPRGLYPKDEILLAQLDMLTEKAELYKFDADLQLLLGYQLLGLGRLDKAVTPLQNASLDLVNANAATILLEILERIRTSEVQNEENVTDYPESAITAPDTEGVETETNLMSEIKSDDTQASAIGPHVVCWSLSVSFALMSLVSILCSYRSQLD